MIKRAVTLLSLLACSSAFAQISPIMGGSSGGDALTTNPLSQFASTTSSQLKGVLSDENAPDGASSKVIFALGSLSIASGKTATFSNSITFAGTDSTTMTFPGTSATLARTDAANTFTGHQTIEGVTSTGATGTGKLVFDTGPQLSTIELGAASDTTLSRASAGQLAVEGVNVLMNGGALGTPASGTLTNATGLPLTGLVSDTTTALGLGTIELGAASDTTLSRSAAGQLAVEGVDVLTTSNTKSSTNKTFTSSTNTIGDGNTYSHDLTAVPNQTGGWNEYFVTGSDFSTPSTTATPITGLTTDTLSAATLYEFQINLRLLNGNDTNGLKIAFTGNGTGAASTVFCTIGVNSTGVASGSTIAITQIDTASTTFLSYANGEGVAQGSGFFLSRGGGTPTMTVEVAKVTNNSAVVRVGSVLRIRKAHP